MGQEDPLEKGMATHSSILAWRIPWTEEPGGLQSMRLQRIDMTELLTHTYTHTYTHTHTVDWEEISRESRSLFGNKATQWKTFMHFAIVQIESECNSL